LDFSCRPLPPSEADTALYAEADLQLHELRWDNTGWHVENLTEHTGAPVPSGAVHAYCVDVDQHLIALHWTP
jgi:hypothetical protein